MKRRAGTTDLSFVLSTDESANSVDRLYTRGDRQARRRLEASSSRSPGSVRPEVRDGRIRCRVHASKNCDGTLRGFDRNNSADKAQ